MENYRINEVKYNDGSILFFAQHFEKGWFKKKWVNVGGGHYKEWAAVIEAKDHYRFNNPPIPIESKTHNIK